MSVFRVEKKGGVIDSGASRWGALSAGGMRGLEKGTDSANENAVAKKYD